MKRWMWLLVVACLMAVAAYAFFGNPPAALRKTYPVYLYPEPGAVLSIGAPVYCFDVEIGYVHKVELREDRGTTIELCIFEPFRLRKSDVCVIHRLHRYDTAKLYIETSEDSLLNAEPLGNPSELRCMIANGPWPRLPGLLEQREN